MAVHHILDEWVADAPFWSKAAPRVLQPEGAPLLLAAHRADFEKRFCTPRLSGGASWICTWKCALRLWPELPRHSNQMLRYLRQPQGLDHQTGLPAHRAFPDAYVTAHHLRDMLNAVGPERLMSWSLAPGLLPRVPHGVDRGRAWSELGPAALDALAKARDAAIRYSALEEIARRSKSEEVPEKDPQPKLF
ncbi:hypothetical protein LTR94_024190 [Friedmanniomyces endolithicus]|nr:hypothetical protein LTR94_024190 [Friedmanniomyces endolithicus]